MVIRFMVSFSHGRDCCYLFVLSQLYFLDFRRAIARNYDDVPAQLDCGGKVDGLKIIKTLD